MELAEAYKTHEQATKLREHENTIRTRTTIFAFTAALLAVAIGFIIRILRHKRIIQQKNDAMVGTINELMAYKNELFIRQEEVIRLQDELQQYRDAQMQQSSPDTDTVEPERTAEIREVVTEKDRALYDRISHEIISRKLYLRSGFNKSELMKEIHVPANKFAVLFKKFAGCSFSQYLKDCQMDYAISLMREHPQWSMEAVAKEAQMSKATFYRQFQEKYGMNPSSYIKKVLLPPPICKALINSILKMKSDFLRHLFA